ncbi:flagellar protein export ATPase FliI [Pseudaeromonas pectinilytica]
MIQVQVGPELIGRIIDPLSKPYDQLADCTELKSVTLHPESINPLERKRIDTQIETGISLIDLFLPLGQGQRIGIFAGSGVGKSSLLGMFAKSATSDINVIAMIGERGREVRDFIEDNLGQSGMSKSIVVVATAEQSPVMRVRALYTAMAIADYFSSQGQHVLLTVDSITRFAMALREIALSVGEPPSSRGYTPSVLSTLPVIVERAGNFSAGSISAIFTVLVEGDDFNEPITDTMRGILDGHLILRREIADKGQYPAVDIFKSNSRLASALQDKSTLELVKRAKLILLEMQKVEEMKELGVYRVNENTELDSKYETGLKILNLLAQDKSYFIPLEQSLSQLQRLLVS